MTLEEYFAQDQYFSESQQEFVSIDAMPWLRAYYSFRKLMTAAPEIFPGQPLYHRFFFRLSPPRSVLTESLKTYGEVSCMYQVWGDNTGLTRKQARDRLYRAAKYAGVKVKTHDAQHDSRGGNFILAEVVNETSVRLRGQLVA